MGVGGRDRRRPARRRIGLLARSPRPARDPLFLAAVELSAGDRAERSLLSPLGRAGGILRALRAADPRLRAGHGGRARHAATAVLPCQHRGDPAMGTGPCAAGRAGGVRAARICRPAPSCGDRETLLDTGRRRRRATGSARYLDDPPPPWRWVDRVPRTDPEGCSIRFRPATFLVTR